ncbi:right-handed parallel beta-helix repeat-containing protein [Amycolatopsis nigrescens]|uniref:right-handed parallel beta-helix repeat-containing protein n=1 Tax=Amycolatopsis nigrescens TaxID=381445 RepID=UPI001FE05A47|nr:right-handed parallel beta-helix repeat-containing protein [Amycolatopsis nigrescens]
MGMRAFAVAAMIAAATMTGQASAAEPVTGAGLECTRHVSGQVDARSAEPGDVVCIDGPLQADRLEITKGGTPEKPITYAGNGKSVGGITIEADNVIVDGYLMDKPEAPGIWLEGNNVTVQNNTVTNPRDGDGDGLRFFGEDLRILNNKISGTSNDNGHADCMQTYASDTPPSKNVLIEGNRCERIDNMCLMAEGPNDGEGDGEGHTSDFTIRKNFCETLEASQNLMFEDVQNLVIEGNEFAGDPVKAIGLDKGSTGAHVGFDNVKGPEIEYLVGIDESSKPGYVGPEPGGGP